MDAAKTFPLIVPVIDTYCPDCVSLRTMAANPEVCSYNYNINGAGKQPFLHQWDNTP